MLAEHTPKNIRFAYLRYTYYFDSKMDVCVHDAEDVFLVLRFSINMFVVSAPRGDVYSPCSRKCPPTATNKYHYVAGKTYQYEIKSESLIKVNTIKEPQATLKWSAKADLSFKSPCEVSLDIKDPQIEGEGKYNMLLFL